MPGLHFAPKSHPLCGGDGAAVHVVTKARCLPCLVAAGRQGYNLTPTYGVNLFSRGGK